MPSPPPDGYTYHTFQHIKTKECKTVLVPLRYQVLSARKGMGERLSAEEHRFMEAVELLIDESEDIVSEHRY